MPHGPQHAAIRITPEIEKHLQTLDSAEAIKSYLAEVAVDQQLVTRDIYSPDVLIPTALADNSPKRFGKAIILDGVKHVLQGGSEQELLEAETAIYKEALSQKATPTQREQPRDTTTGRFVEQTTQTIPSVSAEEKQALSVQLQLGQIDVATYLEKTGAVAEYLEKQGLPLSELKAQVQEKQDEKYAKSWTQATEEFLQSPAGLTWPGGDENLKIAGRLLQENGLSNSPSADNLARVFKFMQENDLVSETPESRAHKERIQTEKEISEAQSPADLAIALRLQERAYVIRNTESGGMFGR